MTKPPTPCVPCSLAARRTGSEIGWYSFLMWDQVISPECHMQDFVERNGSLKSARSPELDQRWRECYQTNKRRPYVDFYEWKPADAGHCWLFQVSCLAHAHRWLLPVRSALFRCGASRAVAHTHASPRVESHILCLLSGCEPATCMRLRLDRAPLSPHTCRRTYTRKHFLRTSRSVWGRGKILMSSMLAWLTGHTLSRPRRNRSPSSPTRARRPRHRQTGMGRATTTTQVRPHTRMVSPPRSLIVVHFAASWPAQYLSLVLPVLAANYGATAL